jgi:hypothetical protein
VPRVYIGHSIVGGRTAGLSLNFRVVAWTELSMDQQDLTDLLDGSTEAGSACRTALLEGAELILWQGSVPADRMLAAYRRRHAHVLADAVESVGFTEALEDLESAGTRQLNLAQVTVADPAYVYMLFLTYAPPALVACLGIARS